ncbi:acyltransferase [Thiobacter aerophilum]|uniref:Acyltransferase n=1 Tax=Thiobacter aerophilum TaxID=3121275 RepID=A0ABV0ECP5_9BURK
MTAAKLFSYARALLSEAFLRLYMPYLRCRLGHLGPGAGIYGRCKISFPQHVHIGANTSIGPGCFLQASSQGHIIIGERCAIAAFTRIITPTHDPAVLPVAAVGINRTVEIGDDVWIGTGAMILPGVRIGSRSIVAAGAVVTKDVPEDVMVAGVPARVVKTLLPAELRFENGRRAILQKRKAS